jgi:uncharacterized protein
VRAVHNNDTAIPAKITRLRSPLLSFHAHNGQIFPANFVVKLIYRLSYGYEKINQGHFFVTSGYGFWGVPMRLGSQSEVMIIDLVGH